MQPKNGLLFVQIFDITSCFPWCLTLHLLPSLTLFNHKNIQKHTKTTHELSNMPCRCVIVMFKHFQPIFNDSFDSTKRPKEDDGNVENSLPSAAGINLTTRRGQLRDGPMVSLGWKHRRNTSEKPTLKPTLTQRETDVENR